MKKHVKNYMQHYNYGEYDVIMCESCNKKRAVDIHHVIFRSKCGPDDIWNLIALCRLCHQKAHDNKKFNRLLKNVKRVEFNLE